MDREEKLKRAAEAFRVAAKKLEECNSAPSPAIRAAEYDDLNETFSFQYLGHEFLVSMKSVKVVEY